MMICFEFLNVIFPFLIRSALFPHESRTTQSNSVAIHTEIFLSRCYFYTPAQFVRRGLRFAPGLEPFVSLLGRSGRTQKDHFLYILSALSEGRDHFKTLASELEFQCGTSACYLGVGVHNWRRGL